MYYTLLWRAASSATAVTCASYTTKFYAYEVNKKLLFTESNKSTAGILQTTSIQCLLSGPLLVLQLIRSAWY